MKYKRYILFVFAALLIGFNIYLLWTKNNEVEDTVVSKANTEVSTDDDIVYDDFSIQLQDIDEVINNKITGYLYFGRDTCPICLEFNKYLKSALTSSDLNIYKFDTDYWRDNKSFQTTLDKFSVSSIPMLIEIKEDNTYEIFEPNDSDSVDSQIKAFLFK